MGDYGTYTRQNQDGLVYVEAGDDFGAHGAHEFVRARMMRGERRLPRPQVPEKGPGGPDHLDGESPRWRPGFRHQGVGLSGRLRIMSAPVRYYTREDACPEASSQDCAHAARPGRAESPRKALRGRLPARSRSSVYESLEGEARDGFSTRSSIAQNIGVDEPRRL